MNIRSEVKKLRVCILSGGTSSEREVSINSGKEVMRHLDKKKYEIIHIDPKYDLPKLINLSKEIDVALILLHGIPGEDGTIQGLLDLIGIPYQGAGVLASAIAMNKYYTKLVYRANKLPVAPDILIKNGEKISPDKIMDELGPTVMVKPVTQGSSVGMSKVNSPNSLEKAIETAFRFSPQVLIEKFINGREITGAILEDPIPRALPLIEIIPQKDHDFFDYEAKYKPKATDEICPAPLSEELTKKAQKLALEAHNALGIMGYSRTDMIISESDGEIFLLETNTIPGMTITSLFPQAAKVAGLSFSELLDRLIESALRKKEI